MARCSSDYILRPKGYFPGPVQSYCYSFRIAGGKFYCYKSGQLWKLEGIRKPFILRTNACGDSRRLRRYIFSEEERIQMNTAFSVIVRTGGRLYQYKSGVLSERYPLRWVRSSAIELTLDTISPL
jgi:hypothetical protein